MMQTCGILFLNLFLLAAAHAQTFSIPVPASSVQVTIACPGGVPAAPVGNTYTCPGGTVPPAGVTCPDGSQHPAGFVCPVDPGTIVCPGFTKTLVMQADWANPVRIYTTNAGHIHPNDALVVSFKTGHVGTPANNLARIGAAEWQGGPSTRLAALSPKPCDWGAQPAQGALSNGTSVSIPFGVHPGTGLGYYPELEQNTTYYLNVKNDPFGTCASLPPESTCDLAIDLTRPPGL